MLQQYDSEQFPGLQIVINHSDGKVYTSLNSLSRLINKQNVYVLRHEDTLVKGGTVVDKIKAEVLTTGGVQGATLYGENFIYSLLAKYKPELLIQAAKAGIRLYFYGVAGYTPSMAATQSTKALTGWTEAREFTRFTHQDFQNACVAKGHPARHVHDFITSLITGKTKQQAIECGELVMPDLDPDIGLNYQPDPKELALIGKAKSIYSGLRKGSYKDQCIRACSKALEA